MPQFIYGPTNPIPFVTNDDVIIYYPQGMYTLRGPFYMPQNKKVYPVVYGFTMGKGGGQLGDVDFGQIITAGEKAIVFPEAVAKRIAETNLQALRVFSGMNKDELRSVAKKESADANGQKISENMIKLGNAAASGDFKTLVEMLSSYTVQVIGQEINKPCTASGTTLLHQACHKGHLDVIMLLVTLNADMDKPTLKGTTPRQLLQKLPKIYARFQQLMPSYANTAKVNGGASVPSATPIAKAGQQPNAGVATETAAAAALALATIVSNLSDGKGNITPLKAVKNQNDDGLDTGDAEPVAAANTTNDKSSAAEAAMKAKLDIQKNAKGEAAPAKPKPKEKDLPFNLATGVMPEATLSIKDKTYKGTQYIVSVTKHPAGSQLAVEMTQYGYAEAGSLKLGILLPNSPKILPLLKLHKTKGHDFFPKQLVLNNNEALTAQVGVFRVASEGYEGLDENQVIPRFEGTVQIKGEKASPNLEWEEEMPSLGIERTHSPEPISAQNVNEGVVNEAPCGPKPIARSAAKK